MLIPCIDVMGGRVVQLIGGERKALEFEDPEPWVQKFAKYPLVHIVDLDAAMNQGNNRMFIKHFAKRLNCQIGGGIRSLNDAKEVLAIGAQRVVVGSALVRDGNIDSEFASSLASALGLESLVFSLDTKNGRLAIAGWKQTVDLRAIDAIPQLERFCSAFLYTNVDKEGSMAGFPLEEARALRDATQRQVIVGGGINSVKQIQDLDAIGVDAVVGMAVYTGVLQA